MRWTNEHVGRLFWDRNRERPARLVEAHPDGYYFVKVGDQADGWGVVVERFGHVTGEHNFVLLPREWEYVHGRLMRPASVEEVPDGVV